MSTRLRALQRRMAGTEYRRAGRSSEAIRVPLDAGTFLLVRDEGDEWVVDYYVSERAERWTMRLPAAVEEEVRPPEVVAERRSGGTMRAMGRGDDPGQVPEGYRWCEHCNGYGSSLKDDNERCARCSGTGLVAADRSGEAANAPPNGDPNRPRGGGR